MTDLNERKARKQDLHSPLALLANEDFGIVREDVHNGVHGDFLNAFSQYRF